MPIDALLMRLDGVKRSGDGYIARCPAHDDRAPSLTVRDLDDGRVLLHCFAGCEPEAVLGAIGLDFSDVMPKNLGDLPPVRKSFNAEAVLECVAKEALIAQVCAAAMAKGKALSAEDSARLTLASARLNEALDLVRARS